MNAKDSGGPAFPALEYSGAFQAGMTLRDYFAGQVVAQMIHLTVNHDGGWTPESAATAAYQLADAMIAARTPTESNP